MLLWLRGNKIDIKLELDEIKKSLSTNKTNKNSIRKEFQKRNVFLPFLYVLILFFFQQGGGINGIVPFTATLLSDAGVSNPRTTATYLKVTIICRYIFLRFWNSVHFTGIKFCVG